MTVQFAKVKAGHDKNHIYFLAGEDEKSVFLVNGTTKKLEHPKKKAKKHIQIIKNLPKNITGLFLEQNDLNDEMIKKVLDEYATSILNRRINNKTENK